MRRRGGVHVNGGGLRFRDGDVRLGQHQRQGKLQLLSPAPPYYPSPEETSILGVIYGGGDVEMCVCVCWGVQGTPG